MIEYPELDGRLYLGLSGVLHQGLKPRSSSKKIERCVDINILPSSLLRPLHRDIAPLKTVMIGLKTLLLAF